MTMAHVVTAGALRGELADAQELSECLRSELARARVEASEARAAGCAVLGAVQAAMVPLMEELAAARRSVGGGASTRSGGITEAWRGPSCTALEAEILHLQLDITHFQEQVEKLQVEGRHRDHELGRLRVELSEASESQSYEMQRVRHFEVCRQLGTQSGGWAARAAAGVGRRTLEARAEQKLRESAEQRGGRLTRDLTKLAGDTMSQQAAIEQLTRQLGRVRHALQEKDKRLACAISQTQELQSKVRGPAKAAGDDEPLGAGRGRGLRKESSSTGKLPQLSF